MKAVSLALAISVALAVTATAQTTVHVAYSETFAKYPYKHSRYRAPDLGRALMCHSLQELPQTCKKYFFPIVFTAYASVDATDVNLVRAISIEADKTGVFAVLIDTPPPDWADRYLPTQLPTLDSAGYVSMRGYGIVCMRGAIGGGVIREQ